MAENGDAKDGSGQSASRSPLQEKQAQYKVSPELMGKFGADEHQRLPVVIELNLDFERGAAGAKETVVGLLKAMNVEPTAGAESRYHVFARLTKEQVQELARRDGAPRAPHPDAANFEGAPRARRPKRGEKVPSAIYKIWPDRELKAFLDRSLRTIKADACTRTFGSDGLGIIWAVIDSGIDGGHPHFRTYATLDLSPAAPHQLRGALVVGLGHKDFTGGNDALSDRFGHGTHVAGIIAGATPFKETNGVRKAKPPAVRASSSRDEDDNVRTRIAELEQLVTGVAPRCKLLSLKVLDELGSGEERSLLAALDYVARINEDGRLIRVHGVNISIGYPFDAEWFAAGQSAICVAVNRLVRTGVVVVVAAGNEGSVEMQLGDGKVRRIGLDQSISDPGNADLAITVGSTHGDSPHTYGVSYFSSRGPTIDGRPKPDLVAPGERIVSCASREKVAELRGEGDVQDPAGWLGSKGDTATFYRDETGTSMAAPHMSGAAAALLSIRREFIGQPERIKEIFVSSATDLKRKRDFQGAGLLDLMRAIQSV